MKKNGEYVGVDEKFIPEDEKYVDDSVLGNREETVRKVGKVAKTIGVGYLVCVSVFLIIIAIIFITAFKFISGTFNQVNKSIDNIYSSTQSQISNTQDQFSNIQNQISKSSFNMDFENYSGTVSKFTVSTLIDNIAKNNKTNSDKIITVIYQDKNIVNGNEIIELKKQFSDDKEYEVILDYDANGYVNQVTIEDI